MTEEKRLYYISFEELYHSHKSYPEGEPSKLAAEILRYYGYEVMLAFSIAADASRNSSPFIISVGDEHHPWLREFMENYEKSGNLYVAVEEIVKKLVDNVVAIVVYDGHDVGVAFGYMPPFRVRVEEPPTSSPP
jgi:hypothetical protein